MHSPANSNSNSNSNSNTHSNNTSTNSNNSNTNRKVRGKGKSSNNSSNGKDTAGRLLPSSKLRAHSKKHELLPVKKQPFSPRRSMLRGKTMDVGELSFRSISGGSMSPPSSKSLKVREKAFGGGPESAEWSRAVDFEIGPNGMRPTPNVLQQRMRVQVKELGQNMVQMMKLTYPREVWDACELIHPDEEVARQKAALDEVKEQAAERAASKIRGLRVSYSNVGQDAILKAIAGGRNSFASITAGGRNCFTNSSMHQEATVTGKGPPPACTIELIEENEDSLREMNEERALAWLAEQSGWSVLDVEEVREIFFQHANHYGIVSASCLEQTA
ncbi:unnamed protein product, partial [Polarella glacialis]